MMALIGLAFLCTVAGSIECLHSIVEPMADWMEQRDDEDPCQADDWKHQADNDDEDPDGENWRHQTSDCLTVAQSGTLAKRRRCRTVNADGDDWKEQSEEGWKPSSLRSSAAAANSDDSRPIVDVTPELLEVAAGCATPDIRRCQDEHSRNGVNKDRIDKALNTECSCKKDCGNRVRKVVGAAVVYYMCLLFWGMSKSDQELFIHHSCYTGRPEDDDDDELDKKRVYVKWHWNGERVCFLALVTILGTGPHRFRDAMNGPILDGRRNYGIQADITQNKHGAVIDGFLTEVWMSAAEPLTDEMFKGVVGKANVLRDGGPTGIPSLPGFDELDLCQPFDLDQIACLQPGVDCFGVARRFVPPGTIYDLYLLLLGRLGCAESVPSYVTFWRRWRQCWSKVLKFRKSSQHAECTRCYEFKKALREARTMADKLKVARWYREHLHEQLLDRRCYWGLREASRNRCSDILTIIIDSLEKAKLPLPRLSGHRVPKEMDKFRRPVQVLTASIAHGYATLLFLNDDEHLEHGSSMFLEVLVRTLDVVMDICRKEGTPFPQHLVIQSDNPTNQAKNQHAALFLIWLVARGYFKTTNVLFLRVGHTHEDIDQLFSIIVSIIFKLRTWEVPDDLLMRLP